MKIENYARGAALGLLLILLLTAYSQQPALLLKHGTVQLESNVNEFVKELIPFQETYEGFAYRIVQFDHVLLDYEKERLVANGFKVLEYIPHYAYVLRIDVGADRAILSDLGAYSVLTPNAGMKMHKALVERPLPEHAIDGSRMKVVVQTYKGISGAEVVGVLRALGMDVESTGPAETLVRGSIPQADPQVFGGLPFVAYVELEAEPGKPEALDGRSLHRSTKIDREYAGGLSYDGTGVSIVINDDGFVGPHIDFTGRVDQSDVAGDLTGDHGDMTAGIAGGAGNLDPTIPGMAPGSFIWVRQYVNTLPDVLDLHQNEGVMAFSSSYSNGCNAGYTTTTQQVDDQIFDNPTMIQSFSAGNSNNQDCGYGAGNQWGNVTGGHKIGKNVLAAANLRYNEVIETSSSRGPASDGRLKPDIAAHGTAQMSTDPNNTYSPGGGTSAACPGVTGVFAQLVHAYRDLNGGQDAESALLRGCILNSAYDLGNVGPDYIFGWGRLNAFGAYDIIEKQRYEDGAVSQGGSTSHSIVVPAGTEEMRVMLVWTDPAASTSASKALVNDLDLTLVDAANTTYFPWVLDPTPNPVNLDAPATNGVDTLNNVEQVLLSNPAAGTYTVNVTGAEVPMGPQGYFIVYQFFGGVDLSYPIGGEGLVPGEQVRILWDAVSNTGSFELDYTIDGGANWVPITTVPGNARFYEGWVVPNTISGDVLVRVTRGSDSDMSDAELSIMEVPIGLDVIRVCPNEIRLTWDSVPGATSYTVHQLGAMYMDSIDQAVGNNYYDLTVTDINQTFWWAVTAHGDNGMRSRRANAVEYDGSGLLNCALNDELSSVENISPIGAYSVCTWNDSLVTIEVQNLGLNDQVNFPVGYRLNGGMSVIETFTDTIFAATNALYTFTQPIVLGAATSYTLETWTGLVGDAFPGNDTASTTFSVVQTIGLAPFYEDFESFNSCSDANDCGLTNCSLGSIWYNQTNGETDDIDWRVDNGGTPSQDTGPNVDKDPGTFGGNYVYTEASGGCTGQEAHLVSQCIDLSTATNPMLQFSYHMYGNNLGSLHVDVHDGSVWNLDVVPAIVGDQGNQWLDQQVDLFPYVGSTIVLRLRGITGNDWSSDIALDAILVSDSLINGINDNNANAQVRLFPNPTNGQLKLTFEGDLQGAAQIEVYDARGALVGIDRIGAMVGQVDLDYAALEVGIYTLILRAEDGWSSAERFIVQR